MRCTCETARWEAWNEAIEAAAIEADREWLEGKGSIARRTAKWIAADIRALKKPVQGFRPSYDPPVSYREIP